MLDLPRIAEIAQEVAVQVLGCDVVADIRVAEMADWYGEDALEVEVVFAQPIGPRVIDGEKAGTLRLWLGDRLFDLGESRFTHFRYTQPKVLAPIGDSGP